MKNPLLLTDYYKTVHSAQYPEGLEYITAYYTPRMTRIPDKHVIMFGLQEFVMKQLIENFNDNFFNLPVEEVVKDYKRTLEFTLGATVVDTDKIVELHSLGYLPLEIKALKEGTMAPIQTPMISITNTNPKFAWVVNAIETLMSTSLWNGMLAANLGYNTRKIVDMAFTDTGVTSLSPWRGISEFSMRGQESLESSQRASAAWLLSHYNTATIPAIDYLETYYGANIETEIVGLGLPSTEHSVMCSNFSIDGDEITMVKRLLTEIYPKTSFSMVSDSYDYWNLLDRLVEVREEILAHEGTMLIRGDSGDPVEIVSGYPIINLDTLTIDVKSKEGQSYPLGEKEDLVASVVGARMFSIDELRVGRNIIQLDGDFYYVEVSDIGIDKVELTGLYDLPADMLGTVGTLYNHFGGTINEAGYRELNSHIKAMYGDSITPTRMKEIYKRLKDKGFAANCCSLGVGSFSFQAFEAEDGTLSPYTRDTFGVAIKTTHGIVNGREIFIEKKPKTDTGNFKTSQKGLCYVYEENNEIKVRDGYYTHDFPTEGHLLEQVFYNGTLTRFQTLSEIRKMLHG